MSGSRPRVALGLSARDSILEPKHPFVSLLKENGCDALQVRDGDPAALSSDLLILYGNCRAFRQYAQLLREHPDKRPRVAIWQVDPLPPEEFDRELEAQALDWLSRRGRSRFMRPFELMSGHRLFAQIARSGFGRYSDRARGNFVDASMARTVVEAFAYLRRASDEGWIDHIYPTTIGKQRFLASRGFESHPVVPASYYKELGEERNVERDIDVMFIGRLATKYRRKRLGTVTKPLEDFGAKVVVVERNCYGEERTALLNRAKLVLHIHKYPWDTPWRRWAMAAVCGTPVISEKLDEPDHFGPGRHYLEAPYKDLPEAIQQALSDPERLRLVARQCLTHVREHSNAAHSLATIVSGSVGAA